MFSFYRWKGWKIALLVLTVISDDYDRMDKLLHSIAEIIMKYE